MLWRLIQWSKKIRMLPCSSRKKIKIWNFSAQKIHGDQIPVQKKYTMSQSPFNVRSRYKVLVYVEWSSDVSTFGNKRGEKSVILLSNANNDVEYSIYFLSAQSDMSFSMSIACLCNWLKFKRESFDSKMISFFKIDTLIFIGNANCCIRMNLFKNCTLFYSKFWIFNRSLRKEQEMKKTLHGNLSTCKF